MLTNEDTDLIKKIVREVVREELARHRVPLVDLGRVVEMNPLLPLRTTEEMPCGPVKPRS